MALTLVFLGRLEDLAGMGHMSVPLDGPHGALSLSGLLARLPGELATQLQGPKVKMALNGAILAPGADPALADGDELAFLPPVSGG